MVQPCHFPCRLRSMCRPPGCANLRKQKEELAQRAEVLQADVKSKQRGLILATAPTGTHPAKG